MTPIFQTIWRFFLIQSQSSAILLPSAIFQKIIFSFRQLHIFYLIKPNFERFEKPYFFSRTLRQICDLMRFFVKITVFFEIPIFFFNRSHFLIFWTFWEVLLFQSHFAANLLLLAFSKKIQFFSGKPIHFFSKENPIF